MTEEKISFDQGRLDADLAAKIEHYSRRTRYLEALGTVGQAASSSLTLTEVLDQALDATLAVTGMEAGEVWILNTAAGEVRLVRHRGLIPEAFWERSSFALWEGIPGLVAATGEAVVIADLAEEPRFLRKGVVAAGFKTFVALPLKAKGEIAGCLNVAERRLRAITEDDAQLLSAIGAVVGMAVANANLYEQLKGATQQLEIATRQLETKLGELERTQAQLIATEHLGATDRIPPELPTTSPMSE